MDYYAYPYCGDIPVCNMRTHLVSGSSYSKVTHGGKQRPEQYEEKLGKMMRRTGLELEGTNLGTSLLTVSDAMSQLADTKNQFDDASKAEFLGLFYPGIWPLNFTASFTIDFSRPPTANDGQRYQRSCPS